MKASASSTSQRLGHRCQDIRGSNECDLIEHTLIDVIEARSLTRETNHNDGGPQFSAALGQWLAASRYVAIVLAIISFNHSWLFLVSLLMSQANTLASSVKLYLGARQNHTRRNRYRRDSFSTLVEGLVRKYATPVILVGIGYGHGWTLESIGWQPEASLVQAMLAGGICAIGLRCVQWILASRESDDGSVVIEHSDATIIRSHVPRGSVAQAMQAADTALASPILEDIIYRGFFVYAIGQVTQSYVIGIFIGYFLCCLLHLYQGPKHFFSVTLFFVASAALLYSPLGLASVFAFHCLSNLWFVIQLRPMTKSYMASLGAGTSD